MSTVIHCCEFEIKPPEIIICTRATIRNGREAIKSELETLRKGWRIKNTRGENILRLAKVKERLAKKEKAWKKKRWEVHVWKDKKRYNLLKAPKISSTLARPPCVELTFE